MTDQLTVRFNALFLDTETRAARIQQHLLSVVKRLLTSRKFESGTVARQLADETGLLLPDLRQLREQRFLDIDNGSCLLPCTIPEELMSDLPSILRELHAILENALSELAVLKNDLVSLQRYELAATVRDAESLLHRYLHWASRLKAMC